MNRLLYILTVALILGNCSFSKKSHQNTRIKAEAVLSADSLYDYWAINRANTKVKPANRKAGSKLFLTALGTYRNKKNPRASLEGFKQALTYYPSPRIYYELGNALLDIRVLDEALQAYSMAQNFGYKPESKILYNETCLFALKRDTAEAIEYFRAALEAGYRNKANVLKDNDLDNIRQTEEFNILVAKYLNGKDVDKKAFFTLLQNSFPKVNLPYAIGKPEAAYNDKKLISYDYAEFIPGLEDTRFSRDVTEEYSYTANRIKTDSIVVLAYTTMNGLSDTLPEIITHMVSYNLEGKIIDKLEFAGRHSPQDVKTGVFDQNNQITIREYKNTWEKDVKEYGYAGNTILGTQLTDTRYYKLDHTGHFVKRANGQTSASVSSSKSEDF